MGAVRDDLEAKGYKYLTAEVDYIPSTYTKLESEEDINNMGKMLEMFEDNDDVQNVSITGKTRTITKADEF